MKSLLSVAFLNLWLGYVSAILDPLFNQTEPLTEPIPPSQDPWYTAPPGFENKAPGTVLRVRPAPGNLTRITANSSASYNILYRTTDSHFRPTWAVTTLFVPELGLNSAVKQNALLSFQVAYDSPDVDASPSYSVYSASNESSVYFTAALGAGVYVSVPDYEGPLGAFTAGIISGHATLDSIRAVLSLELGLTNTSPVALWGYSGGALATEWASELAVQYAPDLTSGTILGAALGAPLTNVTTLMESVNREAEAGLIPNALLGLTAQYPEVRKYLLSKLNTGGEYNKTGFSAAEGFTIAESGTTYANQDINKYFQNGTDILNDPKILALVNREGVMGYYGVPRWPLFIYQAVPDEITKISETDALVERYCGVGADILFERNSVGSHYEEADNSYGAAVQWLKDLFDGQQVPGETEGCVIRGVTRNVTSITLTRRGDESNIWDLWSAQYQ
ncbi:Trichothecene C-3 esterase [Fusarium irregulare]|uniref:Trichothecene C-3 esterase n=1 Tax=Fusarium irregulare TaxID=2494466 RepID=A0A9W8U6W5_9HYPO|nr:Trichothecene C-3 esterase [Fusarium irregulare]KAJ4007994.1 Trichothecene C-3 esterase [Fusarium irregulare]